MLKVQYVNAWMRNTVPNFKQKFIKREEKSQGRKKNC